MTDIKTDTAADTDTSKWILVVEDDESIAKAYAAKFEYEHIRAQFAHEGDEALGILKKSATMPSLILLDLMLPKKNGFEILKELKANSTFADIPVVILTNLAQENDEKRGMELGAIKYLVKADTKIADILAIVREHIGA